MKESELRKQVRTKIEAGASPQQVYDGFHGGPNTPNERLADLVRYVPTMERRARYKLFNTVMAALLAVIVLLRLVSIANALAGHQALAAVFPALWCAAYIAGLAGVAKFWGRTHATIGVIAFIDATRQVQHDDMDAFRLAILAVLVAIAVLGFYLQRKLTPAYITLKERYTNAEGQDRLREVVRFGD